MSAWISFLALLSAFLAPSSFAGVSSAQAIDLVQHFNSHGKTVLFVFCRDDRSFHCLSFMRNGKNALVMMGNQALWTLPMLADSDGERDYDEAKGNTPQGVYTLNGVMPRADNIRDYGHFRRIVMNILPGQDHDQATLELLPESSRSLAWWKEAPVARDIGRSGFRIHGVGFLNQNPDANNYPFIPTWGCLTTREGEYDGVLYQDQRVLLDSLMRAQNLEAEYDNETHLDGYVVVLNFNGIHSNVSLEDLQFLLP